MSNRLVGAVAGLGLMAAMVPVAARASNPPVTQCSPAAFEVCAAVSSSATWNGTSGTVTLVAWNLFGNASFPGSLSSVITYVGIGNTSFSGVATLASATYNGASVKKTTTGALKKGWGTTNTNQSGNIGANLDFASSPTGNFYGLIGCNQTIANNQLQTCYSNTSKALTLVFDVTKQFNLDGAVWEVHAQEVNGTGCSLWLGSNGRSTADAGTGCGGAVPEPITMSLVGTGLIGMGLARIRRRRKNGDIESA